ncbi:heme o synthase [Malassezia sp. CBS 17886]|nr:heme o synthase [Malassezia sp. CBS 17886]
MSVWVPEAAGAAGARAAWGVRCAARAVRGARQLRRFSAYTLRVPQSDASFHVGRSSVVFHAPSQGVVRPTALDYVWLRDACREPGSVHASTQQKLFHTSDIPVPDGARGESLLADEERPVGLATDARTGAAVLEVRFAPAAAVANAFTALVSPASVAGAPGPHVSHFPVERLAMLASPQRYRRHHHDVLGMPSVWDHVSLQRTGRPAFVAWDDVRGSDAALLQLLTGLQRDGIAFVRGLPTDTTSSDPGPQAAALRGLADRIGELRHTFYGTLWDVQSVASAANIAYTNVDLGFHMDLLYFQNPPRFQLLHMLRKKVTGGQSLFVDSFQVAQRMWDEHRAQWEALAHAPVAFHYHNAGEHYYYTHPTLERAQPSEGHEGPPPDGTSMPRLVAVNYAPPFQAPLPLHAPSLDTPAKRMLFYEALQTFARLTHDRTMQFEHALEPGDCVLFDNRRVLHARKGFDWDAGDSSGVIGRWLKVGTVQ